MVKHRRAWSHGAPLRVCQSERVRLTNPLWYLAALFVVLGGWMAGVILAAGAWDTVRDATLESASERVDAGSGSLAVFTDVRQPERDITCTATGPGKDAEPVDLEAAPIDLTVARDGSSWFLIAFERNAPSDVEVRCTPRDRAADAATYRVAVAEGFADRAQLGDGVTWIATAAGIVLAIATWWTRRKSHQED